MKLNKVPNKLKGWIGLQKIEIFAHHGVYKREKENGSTFYLNIMVKGDLSAVVDSDDISETINYEVIATICKQEMRIVSNTLEHVGYRIIKTLFKDLPISKVKLNIAKVKPSIDVDCASSDVSLTVSRKQIEKK